MLCLMGVQVLQDDTNYYLVMEHCSGEQHTHTHTL